MTARAGPEKGRAADRAGSTAQRRAAQASAQREHSTAEALRGLIADIARAEVEKALAEREGADAGAELLTIAEAARRLSVSESYIRGRIRGGELEAVRLGRAVRVRTADVDALPRRRRSSSAETPGQRAARILAGGAR